MGHWLHGMARRAEQNELNRSSCAEMYARVLGPLRVHGAKTELTLAGGTGGSNPASSAGESFSGVNSERRPARLKRWTTRMPPQEGNLVELHGSARTELCMRVEDPSKAVARF